MVGLRGEGEALPLGGEQSLLGARYKLRAWHTGTRHGHMYLPEASTRARKLLLVILLAPDLPSSVPSATYISRKEQ